MLLITKTRTTICENNNKCCVLRFKSSDCERSPLSRFLQKIQRIAKQNKNTPAPQSQPDPNPVSSADSSPSEFTTAQTIIHIGQKVKV